jgi:hypothetical protein
LFAAFLWLVLEVRIIGPTKERFCRHYNQLLAGTNAMILASTSADICVPAHQQCDISRRVGPYRVAELDRRSDRSEVPNQE